MLHLDWGWGPAFGAEGCSSVDSLSAVYVSNMERETGSHSSKAIYVSVNVNGLLWAGWELILTLLLCHMAASVFILLRKVDFLSVLELKHYSLLFCAFIVTVLTC